MAAQEWTLGLAMKVEVRLVWEVITAHVGVEVEVQVGVEVPMGVVVVAVWVGGTGEPP